MTIGRHIIILYINNKMNQPYRRLYLMTALEAMKRENNIIGFRDDSCYSAIRLYLDDLLDQSKNTHDAYKRYYNEFFVFATGKDISGIAWDDVLSIKYGDVIHFRDYLKKNKKNSNKTINQKVSTLLPLWKELYNYNNDIDVNVVIVEPLKVKEKHNIGSDALTIEEAHMLLDFAKEQAYKGYVKYAFFKTAIATALRKESLLTATFDDLKQKKDRGTGKEYWCLIVYDKTREEVKPITDELYAEIMELQNPVHRINMKAEDNRIFAISETQLVDTLKEFCSEYDIRAKITLHSLRKTSADYADILVGGSIKGIQQQTGHKNTRVLIENYQGTRNSLHSFPGLRMFQEKDDISQLEQLSKDKLVELIKQCDGSVAKQLLNQLHMNQIKEA